MGSFSDYLENKLLDHAFSATTYTPPETLYIGLSTTTIADAGTGITEPSGNAYARVAVTNNATNFPAASGGSKTNGAAVEFPEATGSWGTVTDFFVSDAASGGNVLGLGVLDASKTIGSGDTLSFDVGDLTFTLA